MTSKMIKTEQWNVKNLLSKINNNEICKPQFQRKRKWISMPNKKDNNPSEKKYITFLFDTQNNVHPITFGQNAGLYSNIDGNNRINAISHFMNKPFDLFPEYLEDIKQFINDNFTDGFVRNRIMTEFEKISYNNLMTLKYKDFFEVNFYNECLKQKRDEFEPHIELLQKKLKINSEDNFDTTVKITVTLFEGYTTEELCKTFEDINKYNSKLTENELLACRLYSVNNFTINDKIIKVEIEETIKLFYENRIDDEVLVCYQYDENSKMNAYDFMVGLQNYAHSKCKLIEETNNNAGLSIFFKVYKTMYKGSLDETFTSENVNNFIFKIVSVMQILECVSSNVFIENLTGGGKIFDACNKKLYTLSKNSIYLIIVAIIGYINKKTNNAEILKSIEKCILFHFFVNEIADKECKSNLDVHDSIKYAIGGTYIDPVAAKVYMDPIIISNKITPQIMIDVIDALLQENVKNNKYNNVNVNNSSIDKRRNRKFFEKVLMYYYYKNKVPVEFLQHKFWLEHIFPFSSSWDEELDIDRLGNTIPIIDSINSKRNNKHISEYKQHEPKNFIEYIKDIIPCCKLYDTIIHHVGKKPHIFNCTNYNERCECNEDVYKNTFITYLFNECSNIKINN